MKTLAMAMSAMAAMAAAYATPTVTGTTIEQQTSRTVKVTYSLDEDAVVTLDILTNATADVWVSIGAENITHTWGDVNVLVKGAGTHTLYWAPERSWLERFGERYTIKALVKAWATDAPPNYMVVDLETPGAIRYYETAEQLPDGGLTNDCYRMDRLVMRKIPAKGVQWRMGSPSTETGTRDAKETTHYVTLSSDYYMGVFEVTERQRWYMDQQTAYWTTTTKTCPAGNVPYNTIRGDASTYDYATNGRAVDSDSYLGKLRTMTGVDTFDLPTEAQWEYACRAGTSGPYAADYIDIIGWYSGNTTAKQRVGTKVPNAWGIYDMHGNVAELCLDWCQKDFGSATVVDPIGANDGSSGSANKTLRQGLHGCESIGAQQDLRRVRHGGVARYDVHQLRAHRRLPRSAEVCRACEGCRQGGQAAG